MADFFIAQYLRDPIRREPKNVGIIVGENHDWAAQFLGESAAKEELDLRKIRWAAKPKIYQKWVRYWREEIATGGADLITRLAQANGGNYEVIRGGVVQHTQGDSAARICEKLFPVVVGDLTQANEELSDAIPELKRDITRAFKNLKILASQEFSDVPHPIYSDQQIAGRRATHSPAYFQTGHRQYVMEIANFATAGKVRVRDHAGWAVAMFDDLRQAAPSIAPIAIINARAEDLRDPLVDYSVAMLRESAQLVYWQNPEQREEFLKARREAAFSTGA